MAITYVGSSTEQGGSPVTLAIPTGYQAGDLLIIWTLSGSVSISGWTTLNVSGTNNTVLYKFASASESSVTFSPTASIYSISQMFAYRGVGSFNVISSANRTDSTSPITWNSITTTNAGCLVINLGILGNNSSGVGSPSLGTSRSVVNGGSTVYGLCVSDSIFATSGATSTVTRTITTIGTGSNSISIAFAPDTAPGNFFFMFN